MNLNRLDYETILRAGNSNRKWLVKESTRLNNKVYFENEKYCFAITHPGIYNQIFNAKLSLENADQEIKNIIEEIQTENLPRRWILDPLSTPGNLNEVLIKNGFIKRFSSSAMAINLTKKDPFSLNSLELPIRRIVNTEDMNLWMRVVGKELWKMDEEGCKATAPFFEKLLNHKRILFFGTFIGKEIVSTGGIVFMMKLRDYIL